MEKSKIIIVFGMLLISLSSFADSFIPETQVQAALLGINMDGKSNLLCYKNAGIGYSSVAKI